MKANGVRCSILLVVLIALLAISLPLIAAKKADKDGDIKVTIQQLPRAVRAALQKAAGNGKIEEIEKEANGIYSADVVKDGRKFDIEITANGKLIKNEVDKNDECKKDKECDKDEVAVTLNEVPAVVAATIQNEAVGGTIDKIEKESKEGMTIYEASIKKDGKKLEVKVAEDGTLLKSKVEDDKENEKDKDE